MIKIRDKIKNGTLNLKIRHNRPNWEKKSKIREKVWKNRGQASKLRDENPKWDRKFEKKYGTSVQIKREKFKIRDKICKNREILLNLRQSLKNT